MRAEGGDGSAHRHETGAYARRRRKRNDGICRRNESERKEKEGQKCGKGCAGEDQGREKSDCRASTGHFERPARKHHKTVVILHGSPPSPNQRGNRQKRRAS